MSTPRIQVVSKGRQQPFYCAPNFSSADHPWAGYLFEEMICRVEPLPSHSWPKTMLCLCTGGEGIAHWRHRGTWHANRIQPGSAFILRCDAEVQALRATNSWPNMLLELDGSSLRHIAPYEVTLIEKSLAPAQSTDDARLAALMLAMRQDADSHSQRSGISAADYRSAGLNSAMRSLSPICPRGAASRIRFVRKCLQ